MLDTETHTVTEKEILSLRLCDSVLAKQEEIILPKLSWLGLPVSLAPSRAPRAYPFPLFLTTVNGSRYDPHPPQVEQIGKCLEKKKVNIAAEKVISPTH